MQITLAQKKKECQNNNGIKYYMKADWWLEGIANDPFGVCFYFVSFLARIYELWSILVWFNICYSTYHLYQWEMEISNRN